MFFKDFGAFRVAVARHGVIELCFSLRTGVKMSAPIPFKKPGAGGGKPVGKPGMPSKRLAGMQASQTVLVSNSAVPGVGVHVFEKGKWRKKEFSPSKAAIKIGSETQESEIVVSGAGVDKAQAIVKRMGDQWFLMERGNSDLMRVNGVPCRQATFGGHDTCLVEIGDAKVVLVFGDGWKKSSKRKPLPDDYFSVATQGAPEKFPADHACFIGSHEACDFPLAEDLGAPRFAACIADCDGRLAVIPIGSTVKIGGKEIGAPAPLDSRHVMQFDDIDIMFDPGSRGGKGGEGPLEFPPLSPARFVFLQMVEGGAKPLNIPLPKAGKALVMGRSNEANIVIPSKSVSKQHLHLITYPKSVLVTDLGSSNGTYVNEEKVKKKLMRAGDVLSVGEFHFFLSYALDS